MAWGTTIGTILGSINTDVMNVIIQNCRENVRATKPLNSSTLFDKAKDFELALNGIPNTLTRTFEYENPDKNLVSVSMIIEPTFISSLGNK